MEELESLVRRARSGDLEAFEVLIRRFQDMAHGYAYAILGDFHLAEDVVQEAFIEVYGQLPKLRSPKAFPSWFKRIVFKHCDRVTRIDRIQTTPLDVASNAIADKNNPAPIGEGNLMQEEVMLSIRALPEKERVVTTLFYINGYSQKEIGEFLEVPVTTVKKRLYNSRQKLKERMMDMVKTTLRNSVLPEDFAKNLIVFPFPRRKPQVEIVDLPPEDLEIHCLDAQAYFVPLIENGRCDWTFYDQPDGRLKGINENHVINTEKWENGTLFRIWSRSTHFDEDGRQEWEEGHYLVEDDTFRRIELRKEEGDISISEYMYTGDKSASKPEPMRLKIGTNGSHFETVGISRVTIKGNSWKCLRTASLGGYRKRDDGQATTYAEWYVAEAGRTMFFRRYNGPGYTEKPDRPGSYESLEGQVETEYQGIVFRHWYDCIPDIALR